MRKQGLLFSDTFGCPTVASSLGDSACSSLDFARDTVAASLVNGLRKAILASFMLGELVLKTSIGSEDLWSAYDQVLKKYVFDGRVDYHQLKENDSKTLTALYQTLARIDLSKFQNPKEEIAFWINAYNLVTLYSAAEAYPIESVLKVPNFFKKKHAIGGKNLSLDDIEKEILIKKFGDLRIHFAINCASKSCPILIPQVYSDDDLYLTFDENAVRFINDPGHVRFDEAKGILYLSKIFSWYKEDFVKDAGSLENFLIRFLTPERRKLLESRKWKIKFLHYDWGLNEKG